MSYPPRRYAGEAGEASARLRPAGSDPDLVYPSGVKVDYLATGKTTDGDFGLYRWNFGPKETGPGPHFHRTMTESFFVLTGKVRLYDGTEWVEASPGDYLYVPPGGVHGFRNVTGDPASMLLLFTPGAPREDYFQGLAELYSGKELSEEERDAFFLQHDNYSVD